MIHSEANIIVKSISNMAVPTVDGLIMRKKGGIRPSKFIQTKFRLLQSGKSVK